MPLRSNKSLRLIAGVAAILFVGWGFFVVVDAARYPWARSLTGASTLTGDWSGDFVTPTGTPHLIWLVLGHGLGGGRCTNCATIDGRATTCDRQSKTVNYEIWGDVENWRGTKFWLKARDLGERKSEIVLGPLNGSWEGDELRLTTNLIAPGAPTTTSIEQDESGEEKITTIGGHPDTRAPITFKMARGTEADFVAACKGAAAGRPN
ncbi:MAG: hypothetical protein K8S25_10405 [Alphaproteobacteria bacterium]|nr:hypothetical protein [Alphaproteobacteria bacterium]